MMSRMKSLRSAAMTHAVYGISDAHAETRAGRFFRALAGCHHEPPPKPPAPERPLTKPGDLAGSWVTSDDLDFGYQLTFDGSGMMRQTIERGRMGKCDQDAQLAMGSAARTFTFTFKHDTCDEGGPGAARTLEIVSFTADSSSIVVRGGVSACTARYTPIRTVAERARQGCSQARTRRS